MGCVPALLVLPDVQWKDISTKLALWDARISVFSCNDILRGASLSVRFPGRCLSAFFGFEPIDVCGLAGASLRRDFR